MCYIVAWLAVLALAVVALLRIVNHDGAIVLIWLNAFTRYVYLPAYLALAWAAWQRRWLLAGLSAGVVACHVTWIAPNFIRDRGFDRPTSDSPRALHDAGAQPVRIFFANVYGRNSHHAEMLQEIAAADPDVVVVVEFGGDWYKAFTASPVMAPYKYGMGKLQPHIGSVNVFSRLPLQNSSQRLVDGRWIQSIDLRRGDKTLRIIGLHGPRPIGRSQDSYPGFWRQVIPSLTKRQGPLVVVGDFNATEHSRVYAQLTAARLRSAHDDRGRGYATTWPNGQNWLPPIRIDQVFLSPEVECERIVEGRGRGSDHKPLVVDLRVRADPP
jgi:endonuclease/exonuclease/phosphatase (EEP) superfamily protein YafD